LADQSTLRGLAALFALVSAGTVVLAYQSRDLWLAAVLALVAAGVLAASALRYWTMSCVLTPEAIEVRQWPTSLSVPLGDIAAIGVAHGSNATGNSYCLSIERKSTGQTVRVLSVQGSGPTNAKVASAKARIEAEWQRPA
jgi:hypothetical protein